MPGRNQIINFFSLHRQIFGTCPRCGNIFRLSDTQVYLRERPVKDWMDALAYEEDRLTKLEEKLAGREEALRERARAEGRKMAMRAVKKIDPVFTPRRLNPDDAKVIFHPVDYVVFDGMKAKDQPMKSVILLDRENVSPEHRRIQRSIEKTIEKARYTWRTIRICDDGAVEGE